METWDIYDAAGNKIGRTMQRGQRLRPGDYHLVVHIWFTDTDGYTLIQKRPDHLEWVPGIWAATGGSAFTGEDSVSAAARETEEELGLRFPPDRFVFLKRIVRDNSLADLWHVHGPRRDFQPITLCEDVEDTRWVTWSELTAMVRDKTFHPYTYLDILPGLLNLRSR